MPGTITLKPIEANFHSFEDEPSKGTPYCLFTMGTQRVQGKGCERGGRNPHWNDSVTLKMHNNQPSCLVELKQDEIVSLNKEIGTFEVDLSEIESQGKLKKWYPFFSQDKLTGEILMEAIFTPDPKDPESVFHKKSHQGSLPHGIDLDEYAREEMRWRMEPKNSIAKISETNEFGDYQPHKQLPFGDILHESGSGMIGQGTYYSGQQTSYGEDFPMAHKSVGTNQLGKEITDHGDAYDRANPRDYALFQQQAFEPHDFLNFKQSNPSVIEKTYQSIKNEFSHQEVSKSQFFSDDNKASHPNPLVYQQQKEKISWSEPQSKVFIQSDNEQGNTLEKDWKSNSDDNKEEISTRPSTASNEFRSLRDFSKHNWDI